MSFYLAIPQVVTLSDASHIISLSYFHRIFPYLYFTCLYYFYNLMELILLSFCADIVQAEIAELRREFRSSQAQPGNYLIL